MTPATRRLAALNPLTADAAVLALCFVVGALVSVHQGQDANWDLRNYHLYNAYAFANDREAVDAAPAGLQSYLSPFADLPYYYLAALWLPTQARLVAAIQGLYFGLLIFTVFSINRRVFAERSWTALSLALIATFISVTAAATVSEIGTTFNDIQMAVAALAGVFLLLPNDETGRASATRILASGVAFGLCAAVKLTGMLFVPGAIVALLLWTRPVSRSLALTVGFAAAWALGFGLAYGWWGFHLWHLTGNPVFPFYNNIFHSDWAPSAAFHDLRFRVNSLFEGIELPFTLIRQTAGVVGEVVQRDGRLAAAYVGAFLLCAIAISRRLLRTGTSRTRLSASARIVLTFAIVSYLVWIDQFMILRYAIPIEALGGTIIVLAIRTIVVGESPERAHLTVAVVLSALVAAGLWSWTIYPDWGRVPFGERVVSVDAPPLPPGSLVVLASAPVSFVVPFLDAPGATVVGLASSGYSDFDIFAPGLPLYERVKAIVAAHQGPAFVVAPVQRVDPGIHGLAAGLGIEWDETSCSNLKSNIAPAFLCPAELLHSTTACGGAHAKGECIPGGAGRDKT